MREIAFATDTQLKNIAQYSARREFTDSPKREKERKFANIIPIMDSFLYGATTKGNLSTKVLAGSNQLKDWGIFIIAAKLYNKAIDKIVNKSETLQNFRDNSPILFGTTNTILGVAMGCSAIKWTNKLYKKLIAPIIPQKAKEISKGFVNYTDNRSLGKAINNGMQSFATKYPKITKTLNTVGKWTLPLICLGYITSLAIDICKAKSKEDRIYNKLQDARLAAAQQLASQNIEQTSEV